MEYIDFDEDEDIILPDTLWGEIIYIKFILIDTFKNPKKLKTNYTRLIRQIRFFNRWMKIK